MAIALNLQKMSYVELLALQRDLEDAIAARKVADAKATREKLRDLAGKSGFTLAELFSKGSKRGQAPVKYRNPKDSSQTWTGRGRRPAWLVAAVAKGTKIDAFSV